MEMKLDSKYWDYIAEKMSKKYVNNPFFEYKSNEVTNLIKKWGSKKLNGKILKTDLYEEAVSHDDVLKNLINKNIYGIDISARVVRNANKRNPKLKKLAVCDVKKISFKKNSFDLIISTSTIDHFPEINEALDELFRVTKKGGIMILTLENKHNIPLNLMCKIKKSFKKFNMETIYYDRCYSIKEAKRLVEKAGFKVTDESCIVNTPLFFPIIINSLYKRKTPKIVKEFLEKSIIVFDKIIKKNKFLTHKTGYFIALKCEK